MERKSINGRCVGWICDVKRWRTNATIVAALIAGASTVVAGLIQGGATFFASPQEDSGRRSPPVLAPQPVPSLLPPSTAAPALPRPRPDSPFPPATAVAVFDAMVRTQSPEVIGRMRLQIVEEHNSGLIEVKASWSTGLNGDAGLRGTRSVRGSINAQGTARIGEKLFECRLFAEFINDRLLEGEYTLTDPKTPSIVQTRLFFAHLVQSASDQP